MSRERRIDNETFFPDVEQGLAPRIRRRYVYLEDDFYTQPRPEHETDFLERASASSLRFGWLLFALGWTGILLQRSLLGQIVVGAPLFEEFAKLGLALGVAALLLARTPWVRLPLAWASGAAFGIFEHYVTYSQEPLAVFLGRIAFHAGSAGLSMAVFLLVEAREDTRVRWLSTIPASLLHWGNNFAAVVFGVASGFLPELEFVSYGFGIAMTAATFGLTALAGLRPAAAREALGHMSGLLLPRRESNDRDDAKAPADPPTSSDVDPAAAPAPTGPEEAAP